LIGELVDEVEKAQHDSDLMQTIQNQYYYISAYVWILRNDDKTYYLACPEEQCKRKVIEESVGWRCTNCDKTY
jgi:hypothetical protein